MHRPSDDILTRIGDAAIDETHSYLNSLFQYRPGENVTLTFMRDGRQMQAQVILGESTGN